MTRSVYAWRLQIFTAGFLALLTWPVVTWADGFRNPFHDAAAIGQGNAFRAQADNPSALFYNPAGMTQLPGIQHSFGVQLVSPNTTFTSPEGMTVTNSIDGGAVGLPPPGQFFLTAHLGEQAPRYLDRVWLGLGVLNLFGFANEYPDTSPFSTVITRGQLPLLGITPSIAYQVTDWISIGLGAKVFTFAPFLGEGHSKSQFIGAGNIPGTSAGDRLELTGKGTTAGLDASFLATLLRNEVGKPLMNLGFIWRSQAVLPLKGALLANERKVADAESSLRLPESYEVGLAFWPIRSLTHELKLEVDATWTRWSSIRSFNVALSNEGFLANPQFWNDAITLDTGFEFKWLNPPRHADWEYAIRMGYIYSEAAIPDRNFNPLFPDANIHGITAGVGAFCQDEGLFLWVIPCGGKRGGTFFRKGVGIDLFYMALLFEPRTVTGNPVPGVNGIYSTLTHSGGFTFRINF
jgi:long-chain fatty acid transport protein